MEGKSSLLGGPNEMRTNWWLPYAVWGRAALLLLAASCEEHGRGTQAQRVPS